MVPGGVFDVCQASSNNMAAKLSFCLVLLCGGLRVSHGADKYSEEAHDEEWIDPFDMLNFDPSTQKMTKNKVELEQFAKLHQPDVSTVPPVKLVPVTDSSDPLKSGKFASTKGVCKKDAPVLPHFKRYVKFLLNKLEGQWPGDGKTTEFNMWLKLTPANMELLQKFTEDKASVQEAHEVLTLMVTGISLDTTGHVEKSTMWLEERIGISFDKLVQILALIALATFIVTLEVRLNISWRQRIVKLLVLTFVISCFWTWYELYKKAEIHQQSVAMKNVPKECLEAGDNAGWLELTSNMLRSVFTFQEDNCKEYYEHLLMDPLWKVPPTKALAVTFVRFFVSPLKDVGGAISEFLRALLKDLPLALYPFALAGVSLFLFLLLFMGFGYRIRTFLVSIEPTPPDSTSRLQLEEATNANRQLMDSMLTEMKKITQTSEDKLSDRLRVMEKLSQHSVTYSRSDPQLFHQSQAIMPPARYSGIEEVNLPPVHGTTQKLAEKQNDMRISEKSSMNSGLETVIEEPTETEEPKMSVESERCSGGLGVTMTKDKNVNFFEKNLNTKDEVDMLIPENLSSSVHDRD